MSSRVRCRAMTTKLWSSDDGQTGSAVARSSPAMAVTLADTAGHPTTGRVRDPSAWWRDAVIYELYVRSFADGNGDGIGDLAGVRSRLPYLASLGIDAIWFTPWYRSPLADGGYDIADYRAIDPAFGTLEEAEQLIAEAAASGSGPSSTSSPITFPTNTPGSRPRSHLLPALPSERGSGSTPAAARVGDEIPTSWPSNFSGPSWTRTVNPDGSPGEWYLHLFSAAQPDLNWDHPDVRREHEEVLRFWLDRGAAGIRIDSAALLVKDPTLPEIPAEPGPGGHPNTDRDELHDIYRSWRAIADGYPGTRILVGELWLPDVDRFAKYLRPGELHTAFNFDFMAQPWDAASMRASIDATLAAHAPVGAPATWLISNHDVTRPVTRYGQEDTSFAFVRKRRGTPTDLALGTRRARAASLLVRRAPGLALHLPGRRARPRRGPGPAAAPARGPDAFPLRRSRSRAATAAACRCPGRATPGRSGSARRARRRSRGCASPRRGAPRPSTRNSATRARCSTYTATPCASAGSTPTSATRRCAGCRHPMASWLSRAAPASSPSRTCPMARSRSRPGPRSFWQAPIIDGGTLPPDASAWLRIDPETLARSPGWPTREAE